MTNGNNDIEELEELLSELEGQENQVISPYSEDEDAVTQLMEAPLSDQEWMVQVTALDRRMMATDQLLTELNEGKLSDKTLVWRGGMDDWLPIARVDELSNPLIAQAATATVTVANAAPPAPAPIASAPAWSSPAQPSRPQGAAPPPPPGVSSPRAAAPSVVAAAKPVAPVPVTQPVPTPQTYTARPVAVDFSGSASAEDAGGLLQSKRAILALGSVAFVAVCAIAYSLNSGAQTTASVAPEAIPEVSAAATPIEKPKEDSAAAEPEPEEEPAQMDTADVKETEPAKKVEEPVAEVAAPADEEDEEDADEEKAKPKAKAKSKKSKWSNRRSRARQRRRKTRSKVAAASSSDEQEEAPEPAAEEAPQETLAEAIQRAGGGDKDEESKPSPKPVRAAPAIKKSKGSTFDVKAAKAALEQAASQASNCQPPGGPSGAGRVRIQYAPSGRVSSVSVLTSSFKDTTTGSCVRMLFRRARVPQFKGDAVTLTKSFNIP